MIVGASVFFAVACSARQIPSTQMTQRNNGEASTLATARAKSKAFEKIKFQLIQFGSMKSTQ